MAAAVYVLCALTSLLCVVLLVRSWRSTGSRLLFWCCLGFLGLAINNIILFIDMVVFPEVTYLIQYRALPAVLGTAIMLYGFVMEDI